MSFSVIISIKFLIPVKLYEGTSCINCYKNFFFIYAKWDTEIWKMIESNKNFNISFLVPTSRNQMTNKVNLYDFIYLIKINTKNMIF